MGPRSPNPEEAGAWGCTLNQPTDRASGTLQHPVVTGERLSAEWCGSFSTLITLKRLNTGRPRVPYNCNLIYIPAVGGAGSLVPISATLTTVGLLKGQPWVWGSMMTAALLALKYCSKYCCTVRPFWQAPDLEVGV